MFFFLGRNLQKIFINWVSSGQILSCLHSLTFYLLQEKISANDLPFPQLVPFPHPPILSPRSRVILHRRFQPSVHVQTVQCIQIVARGFKMVEHGGEKPSAEMSDISRPGALMLLELLSSSTSIPGENHSNVSKVSSPLGSSSNGNGKNSIFQPIPAICQISVLTFLLMCIPMAHVAGSWVKLVVGPYLLHFGPCGLFFFSL